MPGLERRPALHLRGLDLQRSSDSRTPRQSRRRISEARDAPSRNAALLQQGGRRFRISAGLTPPVVRRLGITAMMTERFTTRIFITGCPFVQFHQVFSSKYSGKASMEGLSGRLYCESGVLFPGPAKPAPEQ